MKKVTSLLLAGIMVLTMLVGCGKGDIPVLETVGPNGETKAPTQAASGETDENDAPDDEGASSAASGTAEAGKALEEAELLAASYDYEGAVARLQEISGYESMDDVNGKIEEYQAALAACVPVDPEKVPHIFFHSLIVDPAVCFDASRWGQSTVDGYNAWMVTIDEFNQIVQQLYDNDYVYVMLSDLYVKNEDGTYSPNHGILLPEGKKAIVLSTDDLSYYAQYYKHGLADKIVIDENGLLKCQYTDANGNVSVGDYDYLPLLDKFIAEHPDASYKGAKGTIALTGYDGVFGYRTDVDFFAEPTSAEQTWIDAHPECELDDEIEKAKVIAEAIKADGWEFASHSWGHRPMGSGSLGWLQEDTQKWLDRVAPIIGGSDIMIYPHGSDIAGLEDYSSANEKYSYLRNAGFAIFCNVDASGLYWSQFRDNYVRFARINIDGYTMYNEITQGNTVIGQLGINAGDVFDYNYRPTPVVADGAE